MNEYVPSMGEIRADFVWTHTRNFDSYLAGRSLTSEQEFYGDQFDRALAAHDAEVAAKAWAEGLHTAYNHVDRLDAANAAGQGVMIPDPVNPYIVS